MTAQPRLPAEWERHECTWIAWPARKDLWPDLNEARQAYANVINALTEFEHVRVLHLPEEEPFVEQLCTRHHIELYPMALNDSWARDMLPSFAVDAKSLEVIEWRFNSWGEKFLPFDDDAKVAGQIAALLSQTQPIKHKKLDFVFEGGSLHTNGQGLGVTTASCLLEAKRNPALNQAQIDSFLKENLYLNDLLWLPEGIDGDLDTDGHVDNFACFVDESTMLLQKPNSDDQLGIQSYQRNLQALSSEAFRSHNLTHLEGPEAPLLLDNGIKLPVSYINFAFCNEGIILPQFGHKRCDQNALAFFKDLFPKRTIMPCPALTISQGGGGLHCITHEQPRVSP